MTYVLHYAPDNASLIIRLALDHLGLPFSTELVDRSTSAQKSPAFRALNPSGRIPVLITPQGPMFETAAILLWLTDTHGGLGPAPDSPERAGFLKWLFYLSNTPHAALRKMFYAHRYISPEHADALRAGLARTIAEDFTILNDLAAQEPPWFGAAQPTALDFYMAALLRWSALYPSGWDRDWFNLSDYPALQSLCAKLETLPCTRTLIAAEGLGPTPFTNPTPPTPPEGSAT